MSVLTDSIRTLATESAAASGTLTGFLLGLATDVESLEAQIGALQAERTELEQFVLEKAGRITALTTERDHYNAMVGLQLTEIADLQYQLAAATRVTVTIVASEDGSDQTAAIQAQIDAAPDGTHPLFPTIIQFPEGRYHTEGDLANNPRGAFGVIRITNRHNLAIEGPCTLYTEAPAVPYNSSISGNTYSNRRHIWLDNCTNITIRNIRVEGSNYTEGKLLAPGVPAFWEGGPDNGSLVGFPGYHAPWEFEHGFDITRCQNVLLEDCEVDSVWGDGVYIGSPQFDNPSENIVLRNVKTRFAGRQGIALCNCRYIVIEDCDVDHARRSAIDLEPQQNNGFVTDVEIFNCDLWPRQNIIAALGVGDVSRINIHDNTEHGPGGSIQCADAALLKRRSDWTYINNVRIGNFGAPIAPLIFKMTDNITIDGNTIPVIATQSRKCIKFEDCQGALAVTNNNFGDGCFIEEINSAPVIKENNIFGATCL